MHLSSRNVLPVTAILLLSASLAAPHAQACSVAVSNFQSPIAGDVDVPTNAAIFVHGDATLSADAIELVDADGALVPIEARQVGPSGLEVTPIGELLPHHGYTLWARWEVDEAELPPGAMPRSRDRSISFTTGSGPASIPTQLDPPALDVQVLEYDGLDSCGLRTGICVEAARPPDTTLEILLDGDVVDPDSKDPRPRYSRPLAWNDCIEVRVRDVRGNRSEPTVACREQLGRPPVYVDLFTAGPTCDNYEDFLVPWTAPPAEPAWSGCALAPPAAAPDRLGGLVSILGAVLTLARRRRARAI